MWLTPQVGTCVYKTGLTSGSRWWGHRPSIGIPKAIYHYVTNTTKQQPTYTLFQNIMRPKNQLVNPPKMTKFTSICAFSWFLYRALQLRWPLTLGLQTNQSGSRCHMTCKMAGRNEPSRQGCPLLTSTGPLSDLRYRQVQLDWWSTLRMRARQAPLPPTTADCHLDYFPVCMPPRPTVYGWHCGSEIRWHQPDGCQHRVDTSPILTHYAMFTRNIQQWYDKMVLW